MKILNYANICNPPLHAMEWVEKVQHMWSTLKEAVSPSLDPKAETGSH
jgi:hypothetical protein